MARARAFCHEKANRPAHLVDGAQPTVRIRKRRTPLAATRVRPFPDQEAPLKSCPVPGAARLVPGAVLLLAVSLPLPARAAEPPELEASPAPPASAASQGDGACAFSARETARRGLGLEANVLWPFVPGGIFELRLMVPVFRADRRDWRGELVIGAYSDFNSRIVRGDQDGKVANLSGKIGYRQFFVYGLHAEASINSGWRRESDRPADGTRVFPSTIDSFANRLWVLAGYQHEFSSAIYANARIGVSFNVYRSDSYAFLERTVVPGGDLNVGVRF
jgi:hypothetical protein